MHALNLLDDVQVQAIIGAQTSMEANLLAELGEEAKVPVMSLSQPSPSPSPSNKYPFFVEITQDETSQIMGISALIKKFEWRDVILIYDNMKYGRDIIPSLVISLQEKNVYISHKISFATSSRSEQIIEELQKLMQLNTKVFLVHISHLLVPCLFLNAKRLGMMGEGYAWIMTSSSMNFLHSMDLSVIESMQGVVGLKSCIPASRSLHNLTSRLRRKFYREEANVEVRELSADAIWAYDATWALAEAIERARIVNSTNNQPYTGLDLPNDINNTRSSGHGVLLLREILEGRFKGLCGETRYLNGKRNSGAFEIVNVIGKGERTVGLLPCVEGNIKESHLLHNKRKLISTGDLETIIWPGGSTTVLKGSKTQLSEVKLRIGVPVKAGFKELVRVDHDLQGNRTYVTGFCIDVFKAAIGALSYKVHYEFIPFQDANGHSAGTYNDLVDQKYDAVVGDTTITSNSYTATLASMMTVKQIQFNSKVNSIGYQIGTFTKGPIDLNFKGLKQFIHSEEEYADALSRGSKHGGASAIIDEIPYIKIFLAKYSAKFSMIKTKSTTNGFAFVFPKGSKLVHDISRQIETLREEGKLLEMEEAWFQSKTTLMYEDKSNPNTLNLNSFRGLFLVSGVSSASALFLFKVFSLKEKWDAMKKCKVGDMIRGQQQRIRMFFSNMAFQ
ncbi:glutamate receptor 2.2 [Prunus dulcis]|uniref:Glutamate receptor 2.2 n=1 Tax=Prunus dulcis TaxID=3755 RepID=A0A4Y1QZ82_PRUDU|nr:glutamate receptor 2.2 [Prunus dulcis]